MKTKEYEREVMRTAGGSSPAEVLAMCGLGIAGEAGEVADLIKKHLFHDHPLDDDKLIKELGDVLWYFTRLRLACGYSLDQIMEANKQKLRDRFPDGFDPERSRNR